MNSSMHEPLARSIRWTLADIRAQVRSLSTPEGAAMVDEALLGATLEALKRRAKGLEGLRARLGQEDFDACVECGETIGDKRLLAVPETWICIACKISREEAWPMRATARF